LSENVSSFKTIFIELDIPESWKEIVDNTEKEHAS